MGTLYLVATPIGNLDDISVRAIRTLREVSLVAAEDTRHTGRLLKRFQIETPLISYHAYNERARRDELLVHLEGGDLALVSDAGTPGLSDPGFDLIQAAIAANHPVVPIPGPSALLAATTASGLVPGPFLFLGFLPRPEGKARAALQSVSALPLPLVIYESPHRLAATLALLRRALGDRQAVAARELTKLHEEFRRGTLGALADHYAGQEPRGEFVLVIAGGEAPRPPSLDAVEDELRDLLRAGVSPSQAARELAQRHALPRRDLYQRALSASHQPSSDGPGDA